MSDPFSSPSAVLRRARHHIQDLDLRLQAFYVNNKGARSIQKDHQTGQDVHKLIFRGPVPETFVMVAKDALSNLRDTLEHVMYASVLALKGEPPEDINRWKSEFPFGLNKTEVLGKLRGKAKDVAQEIQDIAMDSGPYKDGGDEIFWAFSELRNIKVHRTLLPFAVDYNNIELSNGIFLGGGPQFTSVWNPSDNSLEYMRTPSGTQTEYDLKLSGFVALSNAHDVLNGPAPKILTSISDKIETILEHIRNATYRLAPLRWHQETRTY